MAAGGGEVVSVAKGAAALSALQDVLGRPARRPHLAVS